MDKETVCQHCAKVYEGALCPNCSNAFGLKKRDCTCMVARHPLTGMSIGVIRKKDPNCPVYSTQSTEVK